MQFRMNPKFKAALLILFFLTVPFVAHGQQFAVRANALSLAALTPEIGFEVVTGDRTSLALSAFGHVKPYGIDSKLIAVQPEFRYWFNGRPLVREYIGVTSYFASYDMTVSDIKYDGNAINAGFTGGYVFALGKRFNLELSAGIGVLLFKHKQYNVNETNSDYFIGAEPKANAYGYKLFPSKLGVTFIYIIK